MSKILVYIVDRSKDEMFTSIEEIMQLEDAIIDEIIVDEISYRRFIEENGVSTSYLDIHKTNDFLWNDDLYDLFKRFLVLQDLKEEVERG